MQKSVASRSYGLLNQREKLKVVILTFFSSAIGLMDLVAISIIGSICVALSGAGQSSSLLLKVMAIFFDPKWLLANTFAVLSLSLSLLVVKSIFSLFLNYLMFNQLAKIQSKIAMQTIKKVMSLPLKKVQELETQRVAYALTSGIDSAISIIISSTIVCISDFLLVFLLLIPLFMVSPLLTMLIFLYFGLIAILVLKGLSPLAHKAGEIEADSEIKSMQNFKSIINGYREIVVGFKYQSFEVHAGVVRTLSSLAFGKRLFFQQIPKFVFEFSLVFGSVIFFSIQWIMGLTNQEILASMAIFFIASFRFAPSLLRIQTAFLVIRSNSGVAQSFHDLFRASARVERELELPPAPKMAGGLNFSSSITLSRVNFAYSESGFRLREITLSIPPNTSLALVGPSGSGKSTLVDLILGLNSPDSGSILVSGEEASLANVIWTRKIFYLPQNITILSGSIRDNIAFQPNMNNDSDIEMHSILEAVQLSGLMKEQNLSLDTIIGEGYLSLSGGERQRLGIARALYSKADIIVLDESTSALDSITEATINIALRKLRERCTLIVIAHRLSTIIDFDQVAYMSSGTLKAIGTFEELRNELPEFSEQCVALGL